jgi:hypothetical protein
MRRQDWKRVGLTLTMLSAVAVAAAAQDRPAPTPAPAPPPARARTRTFTLTAPAPDGMTMTARRGRLGVLVDLTPDGGRDSIGARVAGVTPGGPADRAGVRTDDIIVRLNGTRLAVTGSRDDPSDGQSRPGTRLIELASHLDQGDTVRLDVRRDNRPLALTFQAGESDVDVIVRRFGDGMAQAMPDGMARAMPFMQGDLQSFLPHGSGEITTGPQGRISIRIGGPLADLELVKVNPGLAEYFGTSEGLLVVDAPSDSSLNLRAGDVILGIGGRHPTSPAQALRILGTYEPGENVSFEVMRQKRRATVNGKMPAADRHWRIQRNSFEPEGRLLPMKRMQHDGAMVIMM